ncbi:hypothetical protein LJC05_00330 [Bacteroides sp. OttesenSCG-928-J23]|nr:hypothetical protein [Bacteroides sp. OttesenSCG-928-J23]MDL2303916.1 hypothetical protein [Bacteroides sp. OttesenSCG-928-D19]
MEQFLSVFLRAKFNLFYRFGYSFVTKTELIKFNGNITDKVKNKVVEKFETITPFEYDEEYLVLHLKKIKGERGSVFRFEIQDLVAIYPLSLQAKISIESKIDQRIRLEEPFFETILPKIESRFDKEEVEKGINILCKVCEIMPPIDKYISDIRIENIFRGLEHRKNGAKANKIQGCNYWEYLIMYERYDYFPNSILGYFYDAGQIFAFSKGKKTFEGSSIFHFLEKLKSEKKISELSDVISSLEVAEQSRAYVSQATVNNIKEYIVAPLFFMLKDDIRKSKDIRDAMLFRCSKDLEAKYGDSFYYSIVLLGAFWGYRKFYDLYYDEINLCFYKDYKKEKISIDTIIEKKLNNKKEIKVADIRKSIKKQLGEDFKTDEDLISEITKKGNIDHIEITKKRKLFYISRKKIQLCFSSKV